MAEYSRPSPDNGRVITDDEYERLAGYGYAMDGLIGSTADTYPVYADSTGRQVKVRASKLGTVRGYLWGADTADATVAALTNTSGLSRIDRLVLQLSRTTRNVRVALKTGTASASPVPATLSQNTVGTGTWEFPLARWTVVNGYTTVAAVDIIPDGWYLTATGMLQWLSTWQQPSGSALRLGQQGYETDTGFYYRWNGTKWLRSNDEQVVTTDHQWSNTTTFSAMTSTDLAPNRSVGLGFPVAASSRYSWELRLHYLGVINVGLAVRATFPSGARLDPVMVGYSSPGNTYSNAAQNQTTSPYSFGSYGPGVSSLGIVRLGGTLLTGTTAGNFAFEFSQGTASGVSGSWVLTGTSLRHQQIT